MPREVPDVAMLEGKPTIKQWVTTSMKNGIRLNSQKLIDFAEQIDKKIDDNKDSTNYSITNINNRISGFPITENAAGVSSGNFIPATLDGLVIISP